MRDLTGYFDKILAEKVTCCPFPSSLLSFVALSFMAVALSISVLVLAFVCWSSWLYLLRATLQGKKSDVRVHIEKREDRKKAVCRTVKAFTQIEGAESIEALAILVRRIQDDATLSGFFGESEVDRVGSGRGGGAAAAMELA